MDILEGLDPEQREVALAVRGPVCVLAGAGTGKTRAITHRIAYAVRTGVVEPQSVLAVTFTTRAAAELRHRLRALGAPGVQARTFHAAALRQLGYFWPMVIGGRMPQVIESKLPLLAEVSREVRGGVDRGELKDLAAEIEWAKVVQVGPEDYPAAAAKARRTPPLLPEEVARLYAAYEERRRERHLIDFETILELTAAMIAEHPEVAARIRGQYRYFVVDEYQDVNPLQKLLLDAWLGGRDDLCVVGDPNQTIYSFTGATPHYLTGFSAEFPSATVIRLVRTYRSTPQVVSFANRVIAGSPHRMELVSQRPDGPEPVFTEYDDETAEARGVAHTIKRLIERGVPAKEIAVLFRVNAQSEAYEQALGEAGVPYVLHGLERFFERPEVRQAMVLLRGAARAAEPEPLAPAVHAILGGIGLTPEPPTGGTARERWESLKALAELAEDMAVQGAGLPEFVAELERRAAEQHAPSVEGVTLASLHAAKGLEWDAVFLVGLTEGMLPIVHAETPEQIEEERRLLYVGITRAREHLHLSWALARSPGGRRSRRPSRFLDGLTRSARAVREERPARFARGPRQAGPVLCRICGRTLVKAAEQKLGRCLTCPADYDEELLARLKAWRAKVAKEAKVPAYVVFTDLTLQAIAERVPRSEEELLAIAGIGRAKLDRYGEAVLGLCRAEDTFTGE